MSEPSIIDRRVWRVGADIDTDQLAPGAYMKHGVDVIAAHCLEALRPEFAARVRPGDVVVAGPGFGIGSSREQAAMALVHLGVSAVIAPSYGGLFFRNACNAGLLLMTCPGAEQIEEGERVDVDSSRAEVRRGSGLVLPCESIPGFLLEMISAGGLFNLLKLRYPKQGVAESTR